jgi:hypothetical protein
MGQNTMKPITIRAIQAGLPKSSMRATTSDMAFSPPGSPAHVNVYNIYMAKPRAFVKRGMRMDGEIWTQGTPRPPAAKSSNTHEDGHLASDKRVRPLATGYGQRTADSKGSAASRCAAAAGGRSLVESWRLLAPAACSAPISISARLTIPSCGREPTCRSPAIAADGSGATYLREGD